MPRGGGLPEVLTTDKPNPVGRKYVIMGVTGCGKSTIGSLLARQLGAQFLDGDDLHPAANIAKMSAGQPLNDADRAPWLDRIGQRLGAVDGAVIMACSALKQSYRDRIRDQAGCPVTFLLLQGSRAVIESRMALRAGHFMPTSLLDSQFATLEPFSAAESFVVVDIDQSAAAIVAALSAQIAQE